MDPIQNEFCFPLPATEPFASGRLSPVPLRERGMPLKRLGLSCNCDRSNKNPHFWNSLIYYPGILISMVCRKKTIMNI